VNDEGLTEEERQQLEEAAPTLRRMGAHKPTAEANWLTDVNAEFRSRPTTRVQDGSGLAKSFPPEFLRLAEIYLDCMLVAVLASPAMNDAFDDLVVECFLLDLPVGSEQLPDLLLCLHVYTMPKKEWLKPIHNDLVSATFKFAALHKEIETEAPLRVDNLHDLGDHWPGRFCFRYPGFMRAEESPLLTSTPVSDWPRMAVRVPKTASAIFKAKAARDFMMIQERPGILFQTSRITPKKAGCPTSRS
jgi:hypothetical protein